MGPFGSSTGLDPITQGLDPVTQGALPVAHVAHVGHYYGKRSADPYYLGGYAVAGVPFGSSTGLDPITQGLDASTQGYAPYAYGHLGYGYGHLGYYGKRSADDGLRELGSFSKVSGTVFEQNERHLLIKDFNYDGLGLAPIFLAGTTGTPSGDGEVVLPFPVPAFERTFSINDPDLPKLEKELRGDVALKLPSGFKVDQLKWIAVWCTRAKKVFGSLQIINVEGHEEVKVNKGIAIAGPGQPQNDPEEVVGQKELGSFTTFFSKVSGTVFELNEEFLLIKDFNYDGLGLAPIFLAGTTGTPSGDGEVVLPYPVPDVEKTFSISDPDLPKLEKELHGDIALKLPPGFTVDQLKWIAVWCTRAREVFGSLQIK